MSRLLLLIQLKVCVRLCNFCHICVVFWFRLKCYSRLKALSLLLWPTDPTFFGTVCWSKGLHLLMRWLNETLWSSFSVLLLNKARVYAAAVIFIGQIAVIVYRAVSKQPDVDLKEIAARCTVAYTSSLLPCLGVTHISFHFVQCNGMVQYRRKSRWWAIPDLLGV